jgi:LDH2 family malate/lactate/ureidoglycolate dehydrogenase
LRYDASLLKDATADLLRRNGVDDVQAGCVARNLVWSELVGRPNFGLERLPIHLERVKHGLISCPCSLRFEARSETIALLDGGAGFGHYTGELAMRRAVELASSQGIGAVAVRNSNFFGMGAYFVQLAAEAGVLGLAMSNSFPKVAAHGGLKPVLGTNPFAFGAPRRDGRSLLVDMATSALAGSTVREHIERDVPLPEGLAIDDACAPITDPRKVEQGALLPAAGAKGFALSLMVEILAGVLTGAGVADGVRSMYKDYSRPGNNGHFFIALDIQRFMPIESYYERMEGLVALLKASNPKSEVLLPGEIRWLNYDENMKRGIFIHAQALRALEPFGGLVPALVA